MAIFQHIWLLCLLTFLKLTFSGMCRTERHILISQSFFLEPTAKNGSIQDRKLYHGGTTNHYFWPTFLYLCVVLVVLITGGFIDGSTLKSTEIFNPVTKTSCSLPQLPQERYEHSQDEGLVCGGNTDAVKTSCVKWSPASGTWTQSHTLREKRAAHVSWATASGVYLIGGHNPRSLKRSEKVNLDGSVEEAFSLKYDTRLHSAFP